MSEQGFLDELLGLNGKAAIVVGGGDGMGRDTSLLLARAGCDVAVVDIDAGKADAVAAEIAALGRKGVAIAGDATDPAQAAGIVGGAQAGLGRLDILVMVVGGARWASILDVTPDHWDLEFRFNLKYVFFVAQEFARRVIEAKRPAVITAVASISGLQSSPRHAPYGAAKAGLVHLVETMATEWAVHGIRVNAVAPGGVITPRIPDSPERRAEFAESKIPMKRRATTMEIARAILFLSSDLSTYTTGHTLPVEGGWLAANLMLDPHVWPAHDEHRRAGRW